MTTEQRAAVMAKANAAVGLLEAAMKLVSTAHSEGPRTMVELASDTVDINRRIERMQQKLLAIHDKAEKP